MKPFFSISTGAGVDITEKIAGGGLSMTITDAVGLKADTLQISIDDNGRVIRVPRTGEKLIPRGGYMGGLIREYGIFVVDQVTLKGFPQTIDISAQTLAAKENGKRKEPKDFRKEEYPTFGAVYEEIASKAGLTLSISAELASEENEYLAKGEEEYVEFATRIGMTELDATVTVKSGRLIVCARGTGKSASGAPMPTIFIRRGVNLMGYNVSLQDAGKHKEVEAAWYDRRKNKRMVEKEKASDDGPPYLIREMHQSQKEAKRRAKVNAKRIRRSEAGASFTIAGDPGANAGAPVVVSGVGPDVDGTWISDTVTHNFSADGDFNNSISCEPPVGTGKPG